MSSSRHHNHPDQQEPSRARRQPPRLQRDNRHTLRTRDEPSDSPGAFAIIGVDGGSSDDDLHDDGTTLPPPEVIPPQTPQRQPYGVDDESTAQPRVPMRGPASARQYPHGGGGGGGRRRLGMTDHPPAQQQQHQALAIDNNSHDDDTPTITLVAEPVDEAAEAERLRQMEEQARRLAELEREREQVEQERQVERLAAEQRRIESLRDREQVLSLQAELQRYRGGLPTAPAGNMETDEISPIPELVHAELIPDDHSIDSEGESRNKRQGAGYAAAQSPTADNNNNSAPTSSTCRLSRRTGAGITLAVVVIIVAVTTGTMVGISASSSKSTTQGQDKVSPPSPEPMVSWSPTLAQSPRPTLMSTHLGPPTPNPTNGHATTWPPSQPADPFPYTSHPSREPYAPPTMAPTRHPTKQPAISPTVQPSPSPTTSQPTVSPTKQPTRFPTSRPTRQPNISPTGRPMPLPTNEPTVSPTKRPTRFPTNRPTRQPTISPTGRPTPLPTNQPTVSPTKGPTLFPTNRPTRQPSISPTGRPTTPFPTNRPTALPTKLPTPFPTRRPTGQPTAQPATPARLETQFPTSRPALDIQWKQLGADLEGKAAGELFGRSLSISSDGTILAIGAAAYNEDLTRPGRVQVFKYSVAREIWQPLGQDLIGEAVGDSFGWTVKLSADGEVLAVGARYNDGNNGARSNSGHVRVFQYATANNRWRQLGTDLDGESSGDGAGRSIALSSDGSIMAIGSVGEGSGLGQVRVFEYSRTNTKWQQLGSDVNGEAAADYFGRSLSISADGLVVAVGASGNAETTGYVQVFQYDSSSRQWNRLGKKVVGAAPGDLFGYSLDLSANKKTMAVGARFSDANGKDSGHVSVFQYVRSIDQWMQLGSDLEGEAEGDLAGESVALSTDGTVLAVGATWHHSPNGKFSGQVRVFHYAMTDKQWKQVGDDLDGEVEHGAFGRMVAVSADRRIVVSGAPGNGSGVDPGRVRVFQRNEVASVRQ